MTSTPPPLTESTLTAIYRETIGPLYGFVSTLSNSERQLSEDITQETWLRAVREWQRQGVPDHPLAWLRTVARNLWLNQRRRPVPVSLDDLAPADLAKSVMDDDLLDSHENIARVYAALARMSPADAELLESFHFDRRRTATLAERLGVSERAIEGRLRRARERLRQEIEQLSLKSNGDIA